jgi:hypothetical protein
MYYRVRERRNERKKKKMKENLGRKEERTEE